MSRKRGLTPEDKALWNHVARSVAPLHPLRKDPKPEPTAKVEPKPIVPRAPSLPSAAPALPSSLRIGGFSLSGRSAGQGRVTHDLAPGPAERLAEAPVRMDHKTHRQMTRGKLRPEARIDLHGMTLAIAQPSLTNFILGAHGRGCRLVLVITGKGKAGGPDAPLPVRPGALRHNVPHWLHMAPLASVVLQVTPAHRSHGGEGAYYVYLRKTFSIS
ncbi:Smr/MutS family protein [Paracoccus aminophilus]|uniref:Smr protein/MutS2 n=1 Tax=Paracoccus aminophilus JCM 7686 TaxID=1367847 RepID=S5YZ32_PARAH|nr:Smr/MutS family protein [Paracoccus aminophilus]AGT10466.1 Smr protein/MutS2 [Paracoccus aminophilus JCM 7686]